MQDEKVTDIKKGKIVGTLDLNAGELKFLDEAFGQLGAKRDQAAAFASLCEKIDKLKGE
jgi:hypothetical protein